MTVPAEDTNRRPWYAGGHEARLRFGRDQMILFGGEKQRRTANIVQAMPNVVPLEDPEPADVAGFRRLPCQREKALHVIAMGML